MICDFCLGPDPRWAYPAAPMWLTHPIFTRSEDDFAVCQPCHELLERGDILGLTDRILVEQPRHVPGGTIRDGGVVTWPHPSVRRTQALANILRFMDARKGPPVPI